MRYPVTLDINAGGKPVNVPFAARFILMLNPTSKTLYVRVGGSDYPTSADSADITCPAAYAMAWPVVGQTFALIFGEPHLAVQPDGMPTTAVIYFFDGSEPIPAFSPMPLDSLQAAIQGVVDVNLTNGAINAQITNSQINAQITNSVLDIAAPQETLVTQQAKTGDAAVDATIPAGTRAIGITGWSNLPATASMQVTGATSGEIYWFGSKNDVPSRAGDMIVFPFLGSIDNLIQILVSGTGGASYTVSVYAFQIWPGVTADQGAIPYVRPIPDPAPAVAVSNFISAPGAATVILTSGVLAAGRYRVVAGAYSDDTPGVGKRFFISAGGIAAFGPVGAQLSWSFPALTISAGGSIVIENGVAGGAGTLYTGWIVAYRLT